MSRGDSYNRIVLEDGEDKRGDATSKAENSRLRGLELLVAEHAALMQCDDSFELIAS